MKTVFLAAILLFAASTAGAQTTRLNPDSTGRVIWERVLSCAGANHDTTKTFEEINFFERDTLPNDRTLSGEWVSPDTIYITKGFAQDGWVVAHEMLHHALNGPPGRVKHPLVPFQYPCNLYERAKPAAAASAPGVTTYVPQGL